MQAVGPGHGGELEVVDARAPRALYKARGRMVWPDPMHVRLRLAGLPARGELRAGHGLAAADRGPGWRDLRRDRSPGLRAALSHLVDDRAPALVDPANTVNDKRGRARDNGSRDDHVASGHAAV